MKRSCSIQDCGRIHYSKGLCQRHYNWSYKFGTTEPVKKQTRYEWLKAHVHWDSDECLIVPFERGTSGYGIASIEGRKSGCHRIMCELVHGEAPSNTHEAAHTCGRGALGCVSPKHLIWATPSENQLHKIDHGTSNRGQRNGSVKLTTDDVLAIRKEYANGGVSQVALAQRYGITRSAVGCIVRNQTWAWLAATYGWVREEAA